jgi:hypothetical protein
MMSKASKLILKIMLFITYWPDNLKTGYHKSINDHGTRYANPLVKVLLFNRHLSVSGHRYRVRQ